MGDQNLEKSLFASAMSRSSISAYIFTAAFSGITPRAMSAWRKACCCLFRAVSMFVIAQNWAPFFSRVSWWSGGDRWGYRRAVWFARVSPARVGRVAEACALGRDAPSARCE